MNKPESNTALASLALVVRDTLLDYQLDPADVFAAADLDMTYLKDPLNRIPAEKMGRLWEEGEKASCDPHFSLAMARHVTPSTFFALGVSAFASENVLEAFRIAVQSARLVSTGIDLKFHQEQGISVFELVMKPGYPELSHRGIEAGFAGIVHMVRQYMGLKIELEKITFRHAASGDPSAFEDWFDCPVEFNSSRDAAFVPRFDQLISRLPTANAALREANEMIIEDYLSKLTDESLSNRVSNEVNIRLDEGEPVDQKAIAHAVCMSERKLQVALKREGTSFQEILDRIRCRKAIQLLSGDKMPVTHIALQLGFREASSFTRAFKRWTGKTPREYLSAP